MQRRHQVYCLDNEASPASTFPAIFGMDGLGDDRYSTNAVALETRPCTILRTLRAAGTQIPSRSDIFSS